MSLTEPVKTIQGGDQEHSLGISFEFIDVIVLCILMCPTHKINILMKWNILVMNGFTDDY